MFYDQFEVNVANKFMATLDSKMATLGEAKGGHMAIPGQKNLQKPAHPIPIPCVCNLATELHPACKIAAIFGY